MVRVAVVHQGMLYLVKRGKKSFVSPDTIDYPFCSYVLFKHTIEATACETMGELGKKDDLKPRFLIRYTFENDKVKHMVNLFVVCVRSEELMEKIKRPSGKLWTTKQIEENLGAGVFSEYFEQEFGYLQNTILYAEKFLSDACLNGDRQFSCFYRLPNSITSRSRIFFLSMMKRISVLT